MKKLFLASLSLIFLVSCQSHRGLVKSSGYKANLFYPQNMEGLYENVVPEENGVSLWQDLYKNKQMRDLVFTPNRSQVELKFLSPKKLQASLYRNGVFEESIVLKGKVRGDYFVVNRRFTLFPLPIFFYYAENKTILGNDNEGNLILNQGQFKNATILLSFFHNESDFVSARYSRL